MKTAHGIKHTDLTCKIQASNLGNFRYRLKRTQVYSDILSTAERRGTPVLLSASVSDNFGNSPQIAAPRRSRESTQRFYVGWFHVGWQGIGDQSDAVTQNAWFRCALCVAISGEISILIQTNSLSLSDSQTRSFYFPVRH